MSAYFNTIYSIYNKLSEDEKNIFNNIDYQKKLLIENGITSFLNSDNFDNKNPENNYPIKNFDGQISSPLLALCSFKIKREINSGDYKNDYMTKMYNHAQGYWETDVSGKKIHVNLQGNPIELFDFMDIFTEELDDKEQLDTLFENKL